MYYHGEGVTQDNKKAVNLFEMAALAGDRESAANLAKMYEFGMAVELDLARAVKWYLKATEMGDRFSQFSASVMYCKGEGVPRDRVEAAKWWTVRRFPPSVWKRRTVIAPCWSSRQAASSRSSTTRHG